MEDEATGLTAVSLVDFPAVEKDFLLFDSQKMLFKTDDEKQIISGIALLADTPIYRRSETRGEYYIVFEKDTVRQLVEKYSKSGMLNNVNLMHCADTFVKDVYMIESYLIDKQRGICPVEFNDVKDGSWYVSYYVEDKNLWNEIKKGDVFKGFSVEIISDIELIETNKQNKNMNKLFKMAKAILKLADVVTDKATLIVKGELAVGEPVFVEVEGDPVPAEDGDYTMEDGTVIVIVEGVIAEIRPVEDEKPEEQTEIIEAEETPAEDETTAEIDELKAEIERLNGVIAEKDAEIENLKAQIAEKEEQLKMSVEKPITKKTRITDKENKALKYFN